jgi:hypothetical protein
MHQSYIKKASVVTDALKKYVSEDYFAAFLASAFFVTSYMIGVAMKIEA